MVRTHGLKGEVAVVSDSIPNLETMTGLEVWVVPPPSGPRSGRVRSVRRGPKGSLVLIDGFDSIELARAIVGSELMVRTDELPAGWSEPEEIPDYLGWTVVDVERGEIGTIAETILTGANDVWVIEGPFGEVLVPVIDAVVRAFDEETTTVEVALLPGLMPDEEEAS